MEIKGEDFIKKVQLQQEKNEIEQRLNEINDAESAYENNNDTPRQAPHQPGQINTSRLDREIEIQEEKEYSDIMLGQGKSNEQNKKKYLVLGLVLVILFLLTVIIIRLLTNDSPNETDSFTKESTQNSQESVQNENIEEQYQKIINEKLKNIKEENQKAQAIDEKVEENLDLKKIEEKELVVEPTTPETKPDVFEVKKEEQIVVPEKKQPEPKPVVKKPEPKKVVKQVASTTSSTITTKPKGTFVQIGAFSKMPSVKYLNNIKAKGYSYKIYKVSINGKMFHKVLIGPYNSRGQAKLATDDIKKNLNVSGAFILTF
jgi:DedD protein